MHNKRKLSQKLIATILVFCLMFTNLAGLGAMMVSYAADNTGVTSQDENLTFVATISNETGEKQSSYIAEITEENLQVNVNVGVKGNGYLKSPVLEIADLENQMFQIKGEILTGEFIQAVDGNKLYLNQIADGMEIEINIPIEFKESESFDINKINSNINFNLTGTYVDGEGNSSEIAKTSVVSLGWKNTPSIELNSTVEKYVPYVQEGVNYALVQYKVKSNLTAGTESFPIKDTNISFAIPQIEGATATQVAVSAINTGLTNGMQGNDVVFNNDNWNYSDGKVNINVVNPENEGTYNLPKGDDEYVISVTYSNVNLGENTLLNGEVSLSSNVFSAEGTQNVAGSTVSQYDLSKQTGSIVTYSVTRQTENVSKGNIYANYNLNSNFYETEYSNLLSINVSRPEAVSVIEVREKEEHFTDDSNNKYETSDDKLTQTYYKSTTINKENLDSILGEKGNLQLFDGNGGLLVTVDKNTPTDESGNIVINYNQALSKVIVQINNPEAEGILNIVNNKVIGKLSYGKTTAIALNKLTTTYKATALYDGDVKTDLGEATIETNLTGTKSNATINLSRNELSTLVKNENVEINISLNNYNDQTDLFKNPIFEITFPKEVKEITVKTMNVLYGNEELKVEKIEGYKNKDGNVVLKVQVSGTQTQYSLGEAVDGTTIILNSDITLEKYSASGSKTIRMNYYNEAATVYENPVEWKMDSKKTDATLLSTCGEVNIPLVLSAPEGLLNVQELSGYADNQDPIYSINQGEVTGSIATFTDEKIVTDKVTMINNTEDVISNVSILGRVPSKDNKTIATGEALGTTVDVKVLEKLSEIETSGKKVKVYYSENANATKDLENSENGWQEELKSYANVKSFMIVVEGDVQVGDVISYSFKYAIPEQLKANNSLAGTMATYYRAKETDYVAESHKVVLKTVEEPVLSVETISDAGEEVKEGQIITYTVTVKNDGRAEAKDIKLTSLVAEGTTYLETQDSGAYVERPDTKELTLNMGEIEANSSKSISYKVKVNESAVEEIEEPDSVEEPEKKIASTAQVEAEGLEKPIYTQSEETKIEEAEATISISEENYEVPVKEGKEIELDILTSPNLLIENTKVTVELPRGVTFERAYKLAFKEDGLTSEEVECGTYDEATRTVTYDLQNINRGTYVKLKVKVDKVEENGKSISFIAKVKGDNTSEYTSNEWVHTLSRPEFETSYVSSSDSKYIKSGEEIKYTLTIKNLSECAADDVKLSTVFPKELKITSANYKFTDKLSGSSLYIKNDGSIDSTLTFQGNEEAIVTLTGKAQISGNEKQVESSWTLSSEEMDTVKTDKITQIVQPVEKKAKQAKEETKKVVVKTAQTTTKSPSTNNSTYRITGKAWLDSNENGRKDTGEKGLSGVLAKLYNATTNTQIAKATTDGSGEYVFSNLSNGNYYIVFGYNTSKYRLTAYNAGGANSSSNCDVVLTNSLAITDKIGISGNSQGDIDIGLVESKMFDLSLDKTISKVTIQNKAGVVAYDYDDVTTAKVDIRGNQLSSSKVYVEYKVTVRNKGELTGYAKSIVDYIPDGMVFSQDMNPGWYQDAKGNLYSTALANTPIKAGEAKSVKLILVKQMTEDNTGIYNNMAEIAKSFNESAINDIDSVAGNGSTTEDDLGSADVIISVNTGGGVVNLMVLLATLITLFIALYVIKLRIDRNNKGVITWED